jgi:hypothetical protein
MPSYLPAYLPYTVRARARKMVALWYWDGLPANREEVDLWATRNESHSVCQPAIEPGTYVVTAPGDSEWVAIARQWPHDALSGAEYCLLFYTGRGTIDLRSARYQAVIVMRCIYLVATRL